MAQIEIRIKANEGADVISGFTSTQSVNNVSRETSSPTTENNGVNGKSWATGYLSLSDGYVGGQNTKLQSEVNKYNGYMFGATNAQKEYTLEIAISGVYFDKILLIGDKTANQFGTEAILDEGTAYEKTVYSDDASWGIAFEQESNSHTIKITKWNRANYNACFTTLKVFVEYLFLNKGQIDNLSTLSQSTSDAGSIQYGVLANSGDVDIRDIDGELEDYVKDSIISNSSVELDLYINNTKIQKHKTNNCSYNNIDKMLSFSLTNDIEQYKNKNILTYSHSLIQTEITLYSLFMQIATNNNLVNNIDYRLNNELFVQNNIYITVENYLRRFTIKNPYFINNSFENVLQTICETAQLNVIKDDNGILIFISANPIRNTPYPIRIPSYLIFEIPKSDYIVKNKYTKIGFEKQKISKSIKDVINYQYSIVDSNNNLDISALGENSSIRVSGNDTYVCFFFTVTSDENSLNVFDIDYEADSFYSYETYVATQDESTKSTSKYIGLAGSDLETKDFVFNDNNIGIRRLDKYRTLTNCTFAVQIKISSIQNPAKVGVLIRAKNYSVSTKELEYIGTGTLTYNYNKNELLKEDDYYTYNNVNTPIYTFLSNNIINYYKNGIRTASLSMFLGDLYDTSNTKVIDYTNNSELLKIDDNVIIDKDNKKNSMFKYPNGDPIVWRVTGRTFKYGGSPLLKLELQEVLELQ